jgi:cysteine-rich repeat protein
MGDPMIIRGLHILCVALCTIACAVERNDQRITEQGQGVTYWPNSTGETSALLDTSISTGTATSGASPDTGQKTTSGASMTGGEVSGTDTTVSSSSSTGTPGPVCGDGVVEGGEACDDGNDAPDDGCQQCARDSIIFVSSEVYQGFALGGLHGADQRCRSLAAKAELMRFETFRAWLSTPTESAADRLLHSRGPYKLVNGLVVANDWDALTSGTLQNPILVDEHSQTQDLPVWTGTLANGQPALGSEFCGDWNENAGLEFGGVGLCASKDSMWSFYEQAPCGAEIPIYCIEQ